MTQYLSETEWIKELKRMNEDLSIDWTEQHISTRSIAGEFDLDHNKLIQYIDNLILLDKRNTFVYFFQPHLNEYIMGPIAFMNIIQTYIGEDHYDKKIRYLVVMQSLLTREPEWVYGHISEW